MIVMFVIICIEIFFAVKFHSLNLALILNSLPNLLMCDTIVVVDIQLLLERIVYKFNLQVKTQTTEKKNRK